jgi:hypothetical protein
MRYWLAAAGIVASTATAPAQAQMRGLAPSVIANVARAHTIDLRLSQQQGATGPVPLIRGMVVQQDVGTNAFVGVGLANIYGRARSGSNQRISDRPARSRKPAVTFVLKF